MTAQPIHPAVPEPPAAGAAAELRVRIAEHRLAERWLPAYEADWDRALTAARQSYALTPLHTVVREWTSRLDTEPAVTEWRASGADTADGIAIEDVLGPRR
ncbi:DUF6247 family protein [Streptomyces cavernicola]|uniref:DUF6247 family protein n=1 Tax=Streptomyces cavernicola TaxID=3043613 RepID=A0ABT6SJZ4_9ACTN|nr:DUF6247 family protein [Streptomyces sp. B-S-A6]MDI3408374.1 DUF6247 family protein [Streptomyces sp. B-S-A6]